MVSEIGMLRVLKYHCGTSLSRDDADDSLSCESARCGMSLSF